MGSHTIWGSNPPEKPRQRARAQHSPQPLPSPQPLQRTAGPRSGSTDRSTATTGRVGVALCASEVRDKSAVWQLGLSFPGGHSSVDYTPYGEQPPEKPRQRARAQHSPRPFPPHDAAHRRSASRGPDRTERTDQGPAETRDARWTWCIAEGEPSQLIYRGLRPGP